MAASAGLDVNRFVRPCREHECSQLEGGLCHDEAQLSRNVRVGEEAMWGMHIEPGGVASRHFPPFLKYRLSVETEIHTDTAFNTLTIHDNAVRTAHNTKTV